MRLHEDKKLFKEAVTITAQKMELKKIYNLGFSNLVFGKLPDEHEVLLTILRIRERLEKVEWIINPF